MVAQTHLNQQIDALVAADTARKSLQDIQNNNLVVSRTLRRKLSITIAESGRHQKIMSRGWEPYVIPDGMLFGLIPGDGERHTVMNGCLITLGLGFIPIAAALSILDFRYWLLLGITLGCFCLWLFAEFVANNRSDFYWDHRRRVIETDRKGRFLGIRCSATGIPKQLHNKWLRDRHLFQECYIGSMVKEAFYTDVTLYNRTCPFLIGIHNGQAYCGGQWDLSKDLGLESTTATKRGGLGPTINTFHCHVL